jgi:hypothetical protein
VVKPRIARLDRVGEVMLLITAEPGGPGSGVGGGSGGAP